MGGRVRTGRWLMRTPREDVRARVFCLPYSGCGAGMYHAWPADHDGVEFCRVQLPGRENRLREPARESYEEIAAELGAAVRPYLDVPYAFFGHCSAALAAYETAAYLEATGAPAPARLFVSSEVAPQDGPYGFFLEMDDDQLAEQLRTLIRELGGDPVPDMIDMSLRVLRHDVEVNKRYRKADPPRLAAPITVIGWRDDTGVDPALLGGWDRCGETETVLLDGGHYEFVRAPRPLLRLLSERL